MNKEKQIEKDALDSAIASIKKWNSGFPAKTSQEFMCGCGCNSKD